MDPGVLCPNSVLEAIAWHAPQTTKDLKEIPELKGWFRREFGPEAMQVSKDADADAPPPQPRTRSRGGRRGRGGRGGSDSERGSGRRRSSGTGKPEE